MATADAKAHAHHYGRLVRVQAGLVAGQHQQTKQQRRRAQRRGSQPGQLWRDW
jgi:hypothetical protein